MTTAREQAREAARKKNGGMRDMTGLTVRAADAASDVWEPILRDLLDSWDEAHNWPSLDAYVIMSAATTRAKEALR